MNHFEGITVRDHNSGTEMRSSYAAIRARFAEVRPPPEPPPPEPPPPEPSISAQPAKLADLIQSESPRVTLNHGDSGPAASPTPKDVNRYVVYRGFGRYDVIEGRKLNDEPLSKDDARQAQAEEGPLKKMPPRIEEIQNVVAYHYEVTRADLIGVRRHLKVTLPRQIAMYIAKMDARRTLPEIGGLFGDRHHTTVLHAVRKIEALILTDRKLAEAISEIRAELADGRYQ